MATKDDSAPAGLLSRVVRFVRNPSSGFNEADAHDADRESSYSKQMLKEMIERKRRNDFVRKREFDMLRKMRRSEVLAGQDPGLRPSFFQSSMPSKPDDRATTLKKIEQSIARIDAGDYGYCDETGEPIGLARLLARPTATLSLEAQQRREMKQKMFGD